MVHPLNELKDAKKARAEISKVKKAAAGSPVPFSTFEAALSNLRAEFAEQLETALAPVRAALEIDELDYAIDELGGEPLPEAVEGEEDEREAP